MDIVCRNCGSINDYRKEPSGPHIKAICNGCDHYIQFIAQGFNDETIMFYGKYKGRCLKNIPPQYFVWLYENTKVSGSLKSYIEANLTKFKTQLNEAR